MPKNIVPLELPPGVFRNGTPLQGKPRWGETNLVRWREGALEPLGGWRRRQKDGVDLAVPAVPRAAHMWRSNSGVVWMAIGSTSALFVFENAIDIDPITPSDLTEGAADASALDGYGMGDYGEGDYGMPVELDLANATNHPATTWALDNFGEVLIALSVDDGRVLGWIPGTLSNAAPITGSPANNRWMIVTSERMIMVFGAGGNPRKVQWCDQEDPLTWTATPLNQAGDILLQTNGAIVTARRIPDGILVWTNEDLHIGKFLGYPLIYGFQPLAGKTSLASSMAIANVDSRVVWAGNGGFWQYDGYLQPLASDVGDWVFSHINRPQISKMWALTNYDMSEVVWFYPSDASNECDAYVVWNYAGNYWYTGKFPRTTGLPAGIIPHPILVRDDGFIYNHNTGFDYEGDHPFAETWPIELDEGQRIMLADMLIPDELALGDVALSLKTKFYPTGPEVAHGPFELRNPTNFRVAGKSAKIRFTGVRPIQFRIGKMRIRVKPLGGRPVGP